jgi:hypothetical protein
MKTNLKKFTEVFVNKKRTKGAFFRFRYSFIDPEEEMISLLLDAREDGLIESNHPDDFPSLAESVVMKITVVGEDVLTFGDL